jgi:endonuclease/exonuclease/phosphatase (EEP) superfamily protein YafD
VTLPATATPTPAPRPRRRAGPWVAAAVGVAAVPLVLPDLLELDRISPFAQLVAFRPVLLAAAAALLAAVVLARRRAGPVAVALALVLGAGATTLVNRVLPDPQATGPELVVLTVNVYEGRADPGQVAALVAAARPALVSLPEAGPAFRAELAPLVEPLGYRLHGSSGDGGEVADVSALSRADLGELDVAIDDATPFPSVVLGGGALDGLRFVAVHTVAPVPGQLPQWRADLARLAVWCAAPGRTVVAGDLNATLDHSALRAGAAGCADAAAQAGAGLIPTWRSPVVGPQIDHVLSSGGIVADAVSVHDVDGTDHRAVLARLRLPG